MEVNEEKRKKFMEFAGKRVNNVMHDIQILEPMARSNAYDNARSNEVDFGCSFIFSSSLSLSLRLFPPVETWGRDS